MAKKKIKWQQGFEPGFAEKLMRLTAKTILKLLQIDGKSRWSNEFTQVIDSSVTVPVPEFDNVTPNAELWFRTGHGRLFWRATKTPSLSPSTNRWIATFSKSDVFYDVGANIGLFSLMAAKFVGVKVVAIEIDLMNTRMLYENVIRNNCQENVLILPIGLDSSTHQEKLFLKSLSYGDALHNLRNVNPMIRIPNAISINVPVYRLDDLILGLKLPAPTKLKIDVDGIELEILQGASDSLKTVTGLVVEYKPYSKEKELIHDLLNDYGFKFDFDSDEEHPDGCVDGFFARKI